MFAVFTLSNDGGSEAEAFFDFEDAKRHARSLLVEPDSLGDTLSSEECSRLEEQMTNADPSKPLNQISGRAAWKETAYIVAI